jgi:hypothetical protein
MGYLWAIYGLNVVNNLLYLNINKLTLNKYYEFNYR